MKKKIGFVTEEEKLEIKSIFDRRNGLSELAKVVTDENNSLYEKLILDMGKTSSQFQLWWKSMSEKYHWKKDHDGQWEINFDTNEIYLISK